MFERSLYYLPDLAVLSLHPQYARSIIIEAHGRIEHFFVFVLNFNTLWGKGETDRFMDFV